MLNINEKRRRNSRRRALCSTGFEHFCKIVFSLEKIGKMKDGCCRFFVSATAPFSFFGCRFIVPRLNSAVIPVSPSILIFLRCAGIRLDSRSLISERYRLFRTFTDTFPALDALAAADPGHVHFTRANAHAAVRTFAFIDPEAEKRNRIEERIQRAQRTDRKSVV